MRKFLNFANQNNKKIVSNAEEIHKSSMTYFNYLIRLGKKIIIFWLLEQFSIVLMNQYLIY